MPAHNFDPPRGRVDSFVIDSPLLANVLGDPTARTVAVYLPVGYDASDADYPLLVGLTGFTGSPPNHLSWRAFGESLPQRLDRLSAAGQMGPVVAVLPDTFTSLGGNQFVNSPALGLWENYLLDEVVPRVEQRYRVRRRAASRAVVGKSSGGYGALVQALCHGDRWGGVASHSGDVGFDWIYRRDLPPALLALDAHGRDPLAFVEHLRKARKIRGEEMHALMILAMAASYDPHPELPLGVRLPVDLETCELDTGAWSRWLAHDPLTLVERAECRASLARLRALYIDCGRKDQYFLQYPTRALARRLRAAGIDHRYEEFDDDHSSIDYRMDVSLPYLYAAMD